jgi:membrane protease YdiL (CAAX protease family)
MNRLWNVLPAWLKATLYFVILWLAAPLAGSVDFLNSFAFFFILSLAMSWLFLKAEGDSLASLGFLSFTKKDRIDGATGLGIGILMLLCTAALTLLFTGDKWKLNQHGSPLSWIISFFICLGSAFVQEFVFRGYPFQVLLKKYKPWIAQLVIAIPFGLMHLSHTMPVADMCKVMLTTGLGSVLFGLAYLKTKKLFLPVGIHLGWNYAQELIPRTMDGRKTGLVIITENYIKYSDFQILAPYLIVVIVVIVLMLKKAFIEEKSGNMLSNT